MVNELLRAPSILYDLQKSTSEESAVSSLTALSDIISSSQDEMEFLYNSGGIAVIMSFLENDNNLVKICLKILASSSKRYVKVRKTLLENNIFYLLAVKLKKETDFSKSTLILYSVLIVVLVRDDYEAKNQMNISECLSSLVNILSSILDEADDKPLPWKNIELIIYSIIASYKDPRHATNQTEAGRIIPKILEYLERQIIYSESDQLQLAKYFWFFLRTVLDKNEVNQQIFLKSFGLSVLFRSLQWLTEERNRTDVEELFVKITGVLVRLRSQKEFLFQSSNYCPIMILCNVLQTNDHLVTQQIIIFLESLTREYPQSLQLLADIEILKRIEQAEAIFVNSKTGRFCRDLWNRVDNFARRHNSQENSTLLITHYMSLTFPEENLNFQEVPGVRLLKNHFCVVHGTIGNIHGYPEVSLYRKKKMKSDEREFNVKKFKFSGSGFNFYRKVSREKEQKLRRMIASNRRTHRFSILGMAGRKIIQILKTFLSLFNKSQPERYN